MNKALLVAGREFVATAGTKGFIIGAFVVPGVIVALMAVALPLMMMAGPKAVSGTVAVIDPTGDVSAAIAQGLSPQAMRERAQRQAEVARRLAQQVGADAAPFDPAALIQRDTAQFEVLDLGTREDVDHAKAALADPESDRLALVVIDPHALVRSPDQHRYGGYELFVRPRLDDRYIDLIEEAVEEAIRVRRLAASGLGITPEEFQALRSVQRRGPIEVTAEGERKSLGELRMMVSFGFLFLIFLPVMMGGGFLLTTVIEEKSSRVVEVLLSSVSAMELMAGKILGQLGVGLTIMVIYGALGGGALAVFHLGHLLGLLNVVYLLVFFLIAYFLIASAMAAIGAAVNDLREAQSLQTPVILVLMLPYLLWMPITRNPSSAFSVAVSLTPFVNPFAMILRITSTEPPPLWQVALSIVIGVASVVAVMWAAAKIFRIGLLMYGKPPNFATLVRWIRMA